MQQEVSYGVAMAAIESDNACALRVVLDAERDVCNRFSSLCLLPLVSCIPFCMFPLCVLFNFLAYATFCD